jgi:VacB/RNase II family 3'-5' exoribonuclease
VDVPRHLDLQAVAAQIMREYGFEPEFPPQAAREVAAIEAAEPRLASPPDARDLRALPWSSIDNDTSRDLDQVEVAETLADGNTRVLIGIADVDAFVHKRSAIDDHAAIETTTVYTGVRNFPMLPEPLSTGMTSLLEGQDRLAVVTEFVVTGDGGVETTAVYRALVRNTAQLTYDAVGAWLERRGPPPPKIAASSDLQAQIVLQDACAGRLRSARYRHGALDIDTIETRPVLLNDRVVDIVRQEKNRATELIEDFMIAANAVVARTLESSGVSSIRRVVKTPARWDRIVELAAKAGGSLPAEPDAKALSVFLGERRNADPDRFADLSLAVIKLMGSGEYVLERPGEIGPGHFGLAVQDYTHSTAPNRRFADLVTQRLLKRIVDGGGAPYTDDELSAIARSCTEKEDAARKVERAMAKRIAAVAMSGRIGETFDAIVTGASPKGTFVRVLRPRVEGMLVRGAQGVDVGDSLEVRLVNADVERGFIDFARA